MKTTKKNNENVRIKLLSAVRSFRGACDLPIILPGRLEFSWPYSREYTGRYPRHGVSGVLARQAIQHARIIYNRTRLTQCVLVQRANQIPGTF